MREAPPQEILSALTRATLVSMPVGESVSRETVEGFTHFNEEQARHFEGQV